MSFYKTKVEGMTLKEALAEYYLKNPSFTPYDQLKSERAKQLVRAHDISHLIFGCATDLEGETVVQLWTKHAVEIKLPWREKVKYLFQLEALKLVLNPDAISFWMTHREEFKRFNSEILNRSKNMNGKWRYFKEDEFLDQNIATIRKAFGIRIF